MLQVLALLDKTRKIRFTAVLAILFSAVIACIPTQPPDVRIDVLVSPPEIEPDTTFQIDVVVRNQDSSEVVLTEIALPSAILNAGNLTHVSPPDIERTDSEEGTVFRYALRIAPGENITISYEFASGQELEYNGDVGVTVDGASINAPVAIQILYPVVEEQVTETPVAVVHDPIPFRAVVQITAMYEENGILVEGWTGSGSIISIDGLIPTNAHVVLPDRYFPVDTLQIALTESDDQPPVPRYFAEVLQADPLLDIAVIKITTDLDGIALDLNSLSLPTVPLGDSEELMLGDDLTILGYPGIGGATITLTSGEVSGFTSEEAYGSRAFIKTSATIAGGNSGGLAANEHGELIGIPTQLGYGGDDQFVDCRVLADTNRDGVIDDRDDCVPTGGFINALRPVHLAMPLIEAAQRGEIWIGGVTTEPSEIPKEGQVAYQDDFSNSNSGWDIDSWDGGEIFYQEGEYFIKVDDANTWVWSTPRQVFNDVIVTVQARLEQPTGEGDLGIICRYQDVNNFYALEISEDGYFAIWKYERGELYYLTEWQFSVDIPQNLRRVTLTATCVSDRLSLEVDGKLLADVRDTAFQAGNIGLIAGTWTVPNIVVAFDDFIVYQPGDTR